MKFKTLFQRSRPTASMAESDSMEAAATTKRKKKETKALTTTMKPAAASANKNAFITIARQEKCAASSESPATAAATTPPAAAVTEAESNNVVASHHHQPQPDESADSIRFSCENCGGRDNEQRTSGISDNNVVTMQLTEETSKDVKMDIEKLKQELEEEYKDLLEKAHVQIKELTDEVAKLKLENMEKGKEFVELHGDFMLCIRSAERFRFEAEAKSLRLESEVIKLRQELSELRNEKFATTVEDHGSSAVNACSSIITTTAFVNPLFPTSSLTYQSSTDHEAVGEKKQTQERLAVLPDDILYPERVENVMKQGKSKREEKLAILRKNCRGSLRNGLLSWCKAKTEAYRNIEITNFSTSWTNGLALAALVHSLNPNEFDYDLLDPNRPVDNFETALKAAEKLGVNCHLNAIKLMVESENPPWEPIVAYVTEIYLAVN